MNTNQQILNYLVDIKQDVGGINHHLKTLNSKVATNVLNIEKNRTKTDKINITIAKWVGALSVLIFFANLSLFYFFK